MSLLGVVTAQPWLKYTVDCELSVASSGATRQAVTVVVGVEAKASGEVTSLSVNCGIKHSVFT